MSHDEEILNVLYDVKDKVEYLAQRIHAVNTYLTEQVATATNVQASTSSIRRAIESNGTNGNGTEGKTTRTNPK